MKAIVLTLSLFLMVGETGTLSLFDFSPDKKISNWIVVNDGVMGGLSEGNFYLNSQGNAIFEGTVSLENYGGFSSVRHRFSRKDISDFTKVRIHLKGDGKRYQFRLKSQAFDRHSYITYFETSGEWETVEVSLKDLYPTFRGRKMAMPNYPGEFVEEIAFLIGNKVAEDFRMEIDWIELA